MRLSHVLTCGCLLACSMAISGEVARSEERKPDGSLASVRETEVMEDGGMTITHTTYRPPPTGKIRIVIHQNSKKQIAWVISKTGQRVMYSRDEQDRIVEVVWDGAVDQLAYDPTGKITAANLNGSPLKVHDYSSLTWNGLQLIGENRSSGEKRILIYDPSAIPEEL